MATYTAWGNPTLLGAGVVTAWAISALHYAYNLRRIRDDSERIDGFGEEGLVPVANLPLQTVSESNEAAVFTKTTARERADREKGIVRLVRTIDTLSGIGRFQGSIVTENNPDQKTGDADLFWSKRYTITSIYPEWHRRWLPVSFVLAATDRKNATQYLFHGGVKRLRVESDTDLLGAAVPENMDLALQFDLVDTNWRNIGLDGSPGAISVRVRQTNTHALTTTIVDASGAPLPLFVSTFALRVEDAPVDFSTDVWGTFRRNNSLFLASNTVAASTDRRGDSRALVLNENLSARLLHVLSALPLVFPDAEGWMNLNHLNQDGWYQHSVHWKARILPLCLLVRGQAEFVLYLELVTRSPVRRAGTLPWEANTVVGMTLLCPSGVTYKMDADGAWSAHTLSGAESLDSVPIDLQVLAKPPSPLSKVPSELAVPGVVASVPFGRYATSFGLEHYLVAHALDPDMPRDDLRLRGNDVLISKVEKGRAAAALLLGGLFLAFVLGWALPIAGRFSRLLATIAAFFCAGVGVYMLWIALSVYTADDVGFASEHLPYVMWLCVAAMATSAMVAVLGWRETGAPPFSFLVALLVVGEAVATYLMLVPNGRTRGETAAERRARYMRELEEDPKIREVLGHVSEERMAEMFERARAEEERLDAAITPKSTLAAVSGFCSSAGLALLLLAVCHRGMATAPSFTEMAPAGFVFGAMSLIFFVLEVLLATWLFSAVRRAWRNDCERRNFVARRAKRTYDNAVKANLDKEALSQLERDLAKTRSEACGGTESWVKYALWAALLMVCAWVLGPLVGGSAVSVYSSDTLYSPAPLLNTPAYLAQVVLVLVVVLFVFVGATDEGEVLVRGGGPEPKVCEVVRERVSDVAALADRDRNIDAAPKMRQMYDEAASLGCLTHEHIVLLVMASAFLLLWMYCLAADGVRHRPTGAVLVLFVLLVSSSTASCVLLYENKSFARELLQVDMPKIVRDSLSFRY